MFSKKKISENACCARCALRGGKDGEYYICRKKGKVRGTDVCRKYVFDPFAPHKTRAGRFDASMLDPLDFDIES